MTCDKLEQLEKEIVRLNNINKILHGIIDCIRREFGSIPKIYMNKLELSIYKIVENI